VDRLRAERTPLGLEGPTVQVLAAADPANPYGANIALAQVSEQHERPEDPAGGGAYVVLVDGEPPVRRAQPQGLVVLPAFEQSAPHAIGALRRLAESAPRGAGDRTGRRRNGARFATPTPARARRF